MITGEQGWTRSYSRSKPSVVHNLSSGCFSSNKCIYLTWYRSIIRSAGELTCCNRHEVSSGNRIDQKNTADDLNWPTAEITQPSHKTNSKRYFLKNTVVNYTNTFVGVGLSVSLPTAMVFYLNLLAFAVVSVSIVSAGTAGSIVEVGDTLVSAMMVRYPGIWNGFSGADSQSRCSLGMRKRCILLTSLKATRFRSMAILHGVPYGEQPARYSSIVSLLEHSLTGISHPRLQKPWIF